MLDGRGAGNLPAVAAKEIGKLPVVHRRESPLLAPQVFKNPPRRAGCENKKRTARIRPGILPRVRKSTWHKSISSGSAYRDILANFEGHLPTKHVYDFVTVVVEMIRRHGDGRCYFLEHGDASACLAALHFEGGQTVRFHIPARPITR